MDLASRFLLFFDSLLFERQQVAFGAAEFATIPSTLLLQPALELKGIHETRILLSLVPDRATPVNLFAGLALKAGATTFLAVRKQGSASTELKAAAKGMVPGSRRLGELDQDHWLVPIEDRRRQGRECEGMLEGYSLGS